jgi:hypothetical protein
MESLTAVRREAGRISQEAFLLRHPASVLVLREVIEGDMQFADPTDQFARSRPGNTMVHVPRMTASERLRGPRDANRRAVAEETFSWIDGREVGGDDRYALTMGRARECGICLSDFTVSDHHCTLFPIPSTSRVFVEDVGSRNGTSHNGARLEGKVRLPLLSGDELKVGRFVLLFLSATDFYAYLRGQL